MIAIVSRVIILISILSLLTVPTKVLAQNRTVYKSDIDELLTIQSVSVLPFSDNVQGIYARPLENHFNELISKMHRFDISPLNSVGPVLSPDELEDSLEKSKSMAAGVTADAFFAARISKGPNGVNITLSLFLTKDAKLIAKSQLKDGQRYDLKDLSIELSQLLNKLIAQLPYQGRILSRESQRVTVNIGRKDGVEVGQIVSVIQIISVNRHPKFNFIISTEKEIIGRVKLLKVDETLSFGQILAEKERGAIQKNAKIAGIDSVSYPDTGSLGGGVDGSDLSERDDGKVSFGENPNTWVPRKTPTFGAVSARLGDSLYNSSMALNSVGSLNSSTWMAPSVFLNAELWVTSEFSVHAGFKQGIIPIDNPRAGAAPNQLNQSLTEYELLMGYMWRVDGSIWGPTVEALIGYMNYRLYVDSSSPEAFTSTNYTGFKIGIKGHLPVSADKNWFAGAQFFMVLSPHLTETPVTSGASPTNTINMFGLYGFRKIAENLKLIGNLDFEQYSTNFSGAGTRVESATSASQRIVTLSGGIAYLF